MRIKAIVISTMALAMTMSAMAGPLLQFDGTGKGENIEYSNNSGMNFNGVFGGELKVSRVDIIAPEIYSYCANLFVQIKSPGAWGTQILDTNSLSPNGGLIGNLVNTYAPTIRASGSNDDAMILQACVWELLYETSGTFDLNAGTFQVHQGGAALSSGQLAASQTLLTNGGMGVATYYKAEINRQGVKVSQDLVAPVPEPTTIAGIAFGLIGFVRRKARK